MEGHDLFDERGLVLAEVADERIVLAEMQSVVDVRVNPSVPTLLHRFEGRG